MRLITLNDTYTHTHTHTHTQSVGPLNVNTQHSQARDIHATGGIRTRNYSKQQAVAYLRLRFPTTHR